MKKQTVMVALAFLLGFGGVTLSTVLKANAADAGNCPLPTCNGGSILCCFNTGGQAYYKSN